MTLGEAEGGETAKHAPSFVFYGVPTIEAVLMRMGGVPRAVAVDLGLVWGSQSRVQESFSSLRDWISRVPSDVFEANLPQGSSLSGEQLSMLWRVFSGAESE
jgi:helicase